MRRIAALLLSFALSSSASAAEPTWTHWYNEGTRLLQENRPEQAWAYLDAARHLQPWDSRVRENLRISEELLPPSSDGRDPSAHALERVNGTVPFALIEAGLILIAALSLGLRLARRRKPLFSRLVYLTAIFALGIEILRIYPGIRQSAWAPEALTLRSGPGEDYGVLAQTQPGIRLRIDGWSADHRWVRLGFSPERVGWALADAVLHLPRGTEKTATK